MNATITQLELFAAPAPEQMPECDHRNGFISEAYVPGGYVCSACGALTFQYLPQPPEQVGYLTADWAWHHRDGKAWTTQERPPEPGNRSLAVFRQHVGLASFCGRPIREVQP